MNTLNEAAKRQTLIEKLRDLSVKLQQATKIRIGNPNLSHELVTEASYQLIMAAEYIEKMPPPMDSGDG